MRQGYIIEHPKHGVLMDIYYDPVKDHWGAVWSNIKSRDQAQRIFDPRRARQILRTIPQTQRPDAYILQQVDNEWKEI
jgi:hypothetical protein